MRKSFPLVLAAVLLIPWEARGEESRDRERAEELFELGIAQFQTERYEAALASFEESYRLNPVPSVVYNLYIVQRELEMYPEAIRSLERYIETYEGNPARREQARMLIQEMMPWVGTVRLSVVPAEAEVRIDGNVIPPDQWNRLLLEPGPHNFLIQAEGFLPYRTSHEVVSGEVNEIDVELEPLPVEEPPEALGEDDRDGEPTPLVRRWWFWTIVGAVVVGAGLGLGLGLGLQDQGPGQGDIEVRLP